MLYQEPQEFLYTFYNGRECMTARTILYTTAVTQTSLPTPVHQQTIVKTCTCLSICLCLHLYRQEYHHTFI